MSGDKANVSNKKSASRQQQTAKKQTGTRESVRKSPPVKSVSGKGGAGKSGTTAKLTEVWVAKKATDDGRASRKWNEPTASTANSRLLELADIALGLKRPDSSFRKRRSGVLGQKP